jgi:hypothetical protein
MIGLNTNQIYIEPAKIKNMAQFCIKNAIEDILENWVAKYSRYDKLHNFDLNKDFPDSLQTFYSKTKAIKDDELRAKVFMGYYSQFKPKDLPEDVYQKLEKLSKASGIDALKDASTKFEELKSEDVYKVLKTLSKIKLPENICEILEDLSEGKCDTYLQKLYTNILKNGQTFLEGGPDGVYRLKHHKERLKEIEKEDETPQSNRAF